MWGIPTKVVSALELGSRDDGEIVDFALVQPDGTPIFFEATHGAFLEMVNDLTHALKSCARERDKAGKKYVPHPQPGVVRETNLSSYTVTQGQDGLPCLAFTMSNESVHLVKLTPADARRWRELLDKAAGMGEAD